MVFQYICYGIWKYYSFPSKSIFNRSNIFFLFREIVKLISSSIFIFFSNATQIKHLAS